MAKKIQEETEVKINCKWEDNMNMKTIKYILDFIMLVMLVLCSFKLMELTGSDVGFFTMNGRWK